MPEEVSQGELDCYNDPKGGFVGRVAFFYSKGVVSGIAVFYFAGKITFPDDA